MNRITILLGHTGSGKSEIATNLAIEFSKSNKKTFIIDLDIVNPYFCIRDLKELLLNKYNIEIISSNESYRNAELMVTPKNIFTTLLNEDNNVILDIGGNSDGAKVLTQYNPILKSLNPDVYLVVNPFRIESKSIEEVTKLISKIENITNLKITKLISNANLMEYTTPATIIEGLKFTEELSLLTSIPIKYLVVPKKLESYASNLKIESLIINRYIVTPW